MDIQPQTTQPISDDQELAKVLAGVNKQADEAAELEAKALEATKKEQIVPAVATTPRPTDVVTALPLPDVPPAEMPPISTPSLPGVEVPEPSEDLEDVKKEAINELKPLVDKLTNLPADEKFDLYLLLIRSTDDPELIAPAHEAAKNIVDEERKAQALLDIIKEIDYLSGDKKTDSPASV